jgi:hypothetical protein
VEYLKGLVPVLRWPGGCFADDYHWRDGVGPVARRPKTVNISWGNNIEDNSFGTNEFIGLCRLIAAEPYLSANVGSGTPEEMRDWMEYCNYPKGSALSDLRAASGAPEPFNVKYWGVGNENWGCGGQMTGDEYATQFRRFSNYARAFGEARPFLVACGPSGNNKEWTQKFWGNMTGNRRGAPQGFAMHYYSNGGNVSTKFTPAEMEKQFASFAEIEKAIVEQRALLDTYDTQKQVGLLLDEWGVWDRMVPEEQTRYGRLFQQITMRSAVAAALGLNLQTLGTLINVDLPWNPSRLEQRLGRIKRIGQARRSVNMLNLVYHHTRDEDVYRALSRRMKDKFDIFGGLPDTIEDDWIETEERLEEMMDQYVHLRQKARDVFELRYKETIDPDKNRWELCSRVLARKDVVEKLSESW